MRGSVFTLLGALFAAQACAAESFPFARSWERIDLSAPDGGAKLKALVEGAADETFVHVDWSLHHFWDHDWFRKLEAATSPDPGQKACEAIESASAREHVFDGRPDPNDNHVFATIHLRLDPGDPFAAIGCEYFGADPYVLRIRGLFVVRDVGIATADGWEFVSAKVDPAAVPKRFFKP